MKEETKKPCTPVEEAGRDYNELGLHLHGETVKTATELWEMLPGWMEARRMAFVDPEYNRRMSELIVQRAEAVLKAAKEMAEWAPVECEAARMLANLNGPWSNAACMGYCLMAMQQAGVPETMQRKVLACLEEKFDFYSLEDAEKAGYANTEG